MIEVKQDQYNLEDIKNSSKQIEESSINEFRKQGGKVKGRCLMITTLENGKPIISTMELHVVGSKENLESIIHVVKALCESEQSN
jgi:hypothetical protein